MRPLRVVVTAWTASGPTTPSTSTPSVVCALRSRSAGQRRRRRRVAGDDEQLRVAREQRLGDLEREALELLGRAVAVREARRVAEVEEVLVRELDEQLVQHREPADAGVEDRDRPPARITRSVRHGVSIRTAAEGHGRASAVTSRASRPRSRP